LAELRDYLVGDLPEQTYRTTEGTGRSKRTVTRTFKPRTDFQQKADKAAEDAAKFPAELAETRRRIQDRIDTNRKEIRDSEQATRRLEQLAEQQWALGWPGDPADVPARPQRASDPDDLL